MRISVLLVLLSLFLGGCSTGPKEVMLDSFEGEISAQTVDFGSAEGTSLKVLADKEVKACGQQSLKIDYNLKRGGYMWIARGKGLDIAGANKWEIQPDEINWHRYNAFSIQMYGADSGAVIAFDIKDSGGELWRFLLDDDFSGWKEIVCLFDEFFPRGDWQPETAQANGELDFPVVSFQFEPRLPGERAHNFDCIKLVK